MADGRIEYDVRANTDKLGQDLESANSQAEKISKSGADKMGFNWGAAAKGIGVAVGAAATAIGVLTAKSVESYASYEQLTGGVETLFKSSSDEVMKYANNAYKTAGMSANEYMETVTGFSASLLQSLKGDTEASAKAADQAVTDMSD